VVNQTNEQLVSLEVLANEVSVAYVRYLDTFVKMDGARLLAERKLYIDWLDERAMS